MWFRMDRPAAELVVASLFVEPTEERLAVLRQRAGAATNWDGLLLTVEAHGIVGLVRRNLERAGVELPPAVAPVLAMRAGNAGDACQRARLALQQVLSAAAREGVDVTLIGASAYAFDLYPDRTLRRPGTLEIHVRARDLRAALGAAESAGLLPEPRSLPAWWYRGTAMPLPLAPSSSLLCTARLHTRLHHPSLLLGVREQEVLARRQRSLYDGWAAHVLDPIDRVLDHAVRLAEGAGDKLLLPGRRGLVEAASDPGHPLRLDRVLDLLTAIERFLGDLPVAAVLERARQWRAEAPLTAVLQCLQGLGFAPAAREWARSVAMDLARSPGSVARPSALPATFLPDPIERLPLWVRPTEDFLSRRYGLKSASRGVLAWARTRHFATMASQGAVALIGLPIALVQRHMDRGQRDEALARAQSPQRQGDVVDAWRTAQRIEQQKAIAPRTLSLPPPEESAHRYPDHYAG